MRGFFIATLLLFFMHRFLLSFAALNGFLAVALGAFAAHGLKQSLTADFLAVFHTAANYQMYHALALLLVSVFIGQQPHAKPLLLSGLAFTAGIILFSGSLYALALGAPRGIGIITPFGGLSFLVGWGALALHAVRR